MAKILVSDLMGTLIPDDVYILQRFFAEGNCVYDDHDLYIDRNISDSYTFHLLDKAFINLGRQLASFLDDGNYVKIVTSVNSHETADFAFNEFITRIYESIEKYKNQVSIFFVGKYACLSTLSRISTIYEKNGNIYAEGKNGISVTILDDKVEVFEFIKKEHNLFLDRLFAIGDSNKDIPMLFKCIDLGGRSSIINNELYICNKNETVDSIIKKTVLRNMFLAKIEDEQKSEFFLKEIDKIYKLLFEGKIDLDNLIKKEEIYRILDLYNSCSFLPCNKYGNVSMERLDELDMYPTFADYCSKVLVHKK